MTVGIGRTRARPHTRFWLAFVSSALLLLPGLAAAQRTPTPADTVPADTLLVPGAADVEEGDTVPAAVVAAAESPAAPPSLVSFPDRAAASWASARWVISADEIGRLPGLTLLEIVARLPGLVAFRAGGFGRPEGLTAVGLGGGRLRVIVDGREMAPAGGGSFELESIQLLDVDRVTVERTAAGVTVDVRTFRLEQPDAHSVVELGTGIYQTRVLRALFSRAFGTRSVGAGGFDLVTTRGSGIRETYSHSSAVFRYGFAPTPTSTVEAAWRRAAIDREGTAYPRQTTRTDVSVHGRWGPRDDLVLEAILARSREDERDDALDPFAANLTEATLRGAFAAGPLAAEAALRVRTADDVLPPLPGLDADGRVAFSPAPMLRVEASGRIASGADLSASHLTATATLSPIAPVALFASATRGTRLLGWLDDADPNALSGALRTASADGWRAGVELVAPLLSGGLAAFHGGETDVVPFGIGFDRALPAVAVDPIGGVEGWFEAAVPGTARGVLLDGSYVRVPDGLDRPYTPVELGRLGLQLHGVYYGGQLEPLLRIEGVHRGRARVPGTDPLVPFGAVAPGYRSLDLALQLRILDVQAFLLWNNLLNLSTATDLVGDYPRSVPRIVYGAEWRFRG